MSRPPKAVVNIDVRDSTPEWRRYEQRVHRPGPASLRTST
jgi:hypothetical protein